MIGAFVGIATTIAVFWPFALVGGIVAAVPATVVGFAVATWANRNPIYKAICAAALVGAATSLAFAIYALLYAPL